MKSPEPRVRADFHQLANDLAAGVRLARDVVEECLARIADPAGEGGRAF
ncbi:MAG: hypothetical protein HY056_12895, partial [Proteobacteria bacterium]|nr:hypothetical protein [Pseudomonadota bacterium]